MENTWSNKLVLRPPLFRHFFSKDVEPTTKPRRLAAAAAAESHREDRIKPWRGILIGVLH